MQRGGDRAYALQFACQAAGKQSETRSAPDVTGASALSEIKDRIYGENFKVRR
jgi:hypothetical protein